MSADRAAGAPRLDFTARIPLGGDAHAAPDTLANGEAFGAGRLATQRSPVTRRVDVDGVALLVHGRVRLDHQAIDASAPGDGQRLVAAWRRDGAAFAAQLDGEFVVALCDARSGAWCVAVDRFSAFRVYFGVAHGAVAFGTAPLDVARALSVSPQVDANALLAYTYFHVVPAPLSIIEGVARVDHGEALAGDGRGKWSVARYWTPHFVESRPFDFATDRQAFMAALRTGVGECVEGLGADDVGCFLSGGTDSSTIAGLASEHFGIGARTFSIGFGVEGYDETGYSRLASERFKPPPSRSPSGRFPGSTEDSPAPRQDSRSDGRIGG